MSILFVVRVELVTVIVQICLRVFCIAIVGHFEIVLNGLTCRMGLHPARLLFCLALQNSDYLPTSSVMIVRHFFLGGIQHLTGLESYQSSDSKTVYTLPTTLSAR